MITIQRVSKIYGAAGEKGVRALDDVSLRIAEGELVSLVGASGSGKSTLLNLIGGIDAPTEGTITVAGREITRISDREMTLVRRDLIGIVFQFFNLMPTLSVLENVMLPAELAGRSGRQTRERALELLEAVGMSARAAHRPDELSGGEMQRTAIARALVNTPKILLADEPTGNLDSKNGRIVLDLLRRITSEGKLTLVMATHDPAIALVADRVIEMKDGKVYTDTARGEESPMIAGTGGGKL
jgi:putative ABC transport system ATP-binding protein